MGGDRVGFCIVSSNAAPKDQATDPLFGQLETMLEIACLVSIQKQKQEKKQSFSKRKGRLCH